MVPALAVCRNAARLLLAAAALFPAAASRAQPLTLEEALKAGEALSPALAAQRYAIDAAGHQLGRATELPDPRLRFGIENLPVTGADRLRYDRDFMTARAIGVMQEFPNPAKRAARGERAARLHEVEQANLAAQRVLLRRDVAIAWLELHYAQRARDALARVAGEYALQIDAVAAGIARGRQTAADSYTLRALQEQANDRVIEQERIVSRARIALAALIGEAANRELAAPPDVAQLAPSGEALLARLAAQPLLRVYDERESLARAEAGLARATRNRVVVRIMETLNNLLAESRAQTLKQRGRPEQSLEGHEAVVAAVGRRDPEGAARAMRQHIDSIAELLRDGSGSSHPPRRPPASA